MLMRYSSRVVPAGARTNTRGDEDTTPHSCTTRKGVKRMHTMHQQQAQADGVPTSNAVRCCCVPVGTERQACAAGCTAAQQTATASSEGAARCVGRPQGKNPPFLEGAQTCSWCRWRSQLSAVTPRMILPGCASPIFEMVCSNSNQQQQQHAPRQQQHHGQQLCSAPETYCCWQIDLKSRKQATLSGCCHRVLHACGRFCFGAHNQSPTMHGGWKAMSMG